MAVDRIILRRDSAADWTAANPVLYLGEPGYDETAQRWKMGDGVTPWSSLAYATDQVGAAAAAQAAAVAAAATDASSKANAAQAAAIAATSGQVTDTAMSAALGPTTAATIAGRPELKAALVSPLPTAGSFTYDPATGFMTADQDGNTYTWNADGTPATQTKGGVTRTFHWNTDGTLASVS